MPQLHVFDDGTGEVGETTRGVRQPDADNIKDMSDLSAENTT